MLIVKLSPIPHFEVSDWSLADSFEDFLAEVVEMECISEFVELSGVFVMRRFYPVTYVGSDQMNETAHRFLETTKHRV